MKIVLENELQFFMEFDPLFFSIFCYPAEEFHTMRVKSFRLEQDLSGDTFH